MTKESRTRSIIKSTTYVLTHEILFFCIALFWTGNISTALSIALTGSIIELGYHYIHERIWTKIKEERNKK